jgi:hypothetical protein
MAARQSHKRLQSPTAGQGSNGGRFSELAPILHERNVDQCLSELAPILHECNVDQCQECADAAQARPRLDHCYPTGRQNEGGPGRTWQDMAKHGRTWQGLAMPPLRGTRAHGTRPWRRQNVAKRGKTWHLERVPVAGRLRQPLSQCVALRKRRRQQAIQLCGAARRRVQTDDQPVALRNHALTDWNARRGTD